MRGGKGIELFGVLLTLGMASFAAPIFCAAQEIASTPVYTPEQAVAGQAVYTEHCASCHGESLNDGEASPLSGSRFQSKWNGKTVFSLFAEVRTTMPAPAPGSLSDEQYVNVLAFMFRQNTLLVSTEPLSATREVLEAMLMPAPTGRNGQLEPGIVLPPPPNPTPNPLDQYTPVTDVMLNRPADHDWLTWRRTQTAEGYSPLEQINKENVSGMRVAWSWSLPNGANESTPLVHDGVLFVYGYGDVVQALDATTGDLLWEYSRHSSRAGAPGFKKSIALYGSHVFTATADGHMIALDVKTGEVMWDVQIGPEGTRANGGPLVAKDKIIIGTARARRNAGGAGFDFYGGGRIIAFDAATGREDWRFRTLPGPDEPGGHTWNGLPLESRSGGAIWTPGSYDPELNLVFFGPAPTYDTGGLRERVQDSELNTDALYTNATLALNADTGELVWHFQHLPNDQWDHDWAFERQIMMLPVDGVMTRVVVTAGKLSIHDVVEAETGRYLFSMDLGLQNVVTNIDPNTGAKTVDADRIPGDGQVKFVCPHVEGGKNWIPSAVNPNTKILYVPIVESCMYMTPVAEGERGLLTGVRISLRAREGSDGLYGRIQAINLETRTTVWIDRQRAPTSSGVLATAGGLVFAGYLDRVFAAYDDATGERLWSIRLNEVPNSAPISYAVNGKQYVAVVVGSGGNHTRLFKQLTPEIKTPVNRSSSLWVFELPSS